MYLPMRLGPPSTLIATLGGKAQIITLALDCLARQNELETQMLARGIKTGVDQSLGNKRDLG